MSKARHALALALILAASAASAAPAAAQDGSENASLSGYSYYSLGANDYSGSGFPDWPLSQYAGISAELSSGSALKAEASVGFDPVGSGDVDIEVDRLSLSFSPAFGVSLSAGLMRLKWGTARRFGAIDVLEPRPDPLDPRARKAGLPEIQLELIPNDWLALVAVALPDESPRWSRCAARVEMTLQDLGLDLGLGLVKHDYRDASASMADPPRLDRLTAVLDLAWGDGPIVAYAEAQLREGRGTGYFFGGMAAFESLGGSEAWVLRATGGLEANLDLGLSRPVSLAIEYMHNGDGLDAAEAEAFSARYSAASPGATWIPTAFSSLGGFRRNYAAASVRGLALGRYFVASLSCLACLDSAFLALVPSLAWEPERGVSVDLSWTWRGSLDDSLPGEGLFLKEGNAFALTISKGWGLSY
ncbi:MAG: hypothetical protein Q8M76_12680 [Spirochaetaceae bacterium]|nr:hypothetical protein [Spirochaetaceae bacterium]